MRLRRKNIKAQSGVDDWFWSRFESSKDILRALDENI